MNPYLPDGRLVISNKRAERSIKSFVIGWKNFLFANARGSTVMFSLIQTAIENSPDPCEYPVCVKKKL